MQPFHLAFAVHDLEAARAFYGGLLGCPEGRSSDRWVDFDLRGHQIVAHLVPGERPRAPTNAVDGEQVPARHFGLVLTVADWSAMVEQLQNKGISFLIEPQVRFEGEPGEQYMFFIADPSGNALEFKALADPTQLFAR